jgi:predicted DCC family thiol-disulfide oxidoreductase YuxK
VTTTATQVLRPSSPAHVAASPSASYRIFYDAHCRLCARSRRSLERLRPSAPLAFVDVQDAQAMQPFPMVDRRASLGQMFVLDPAGRLAGGYDALLLLAPAVPLLRPFRRVLAWRPVCFIGHKVYRWVARNRYRLGGSAPCDGDACRVH